MFEANQMRESRDEDFSFFSIIFASFSRLGNAWKRILLGDFYIYQIWNFEKLFGFCRSICQMALIARFFKSFVTTLKAPQNDTSGKGMNKERKDELECGCER